MTAATLSQAHTSDSVAAKLREAARAQSAAFPEDRPEWKAADLIEKQAADLAWLRNSYRETTCAHFNEVQRGEAQAAEVARLSGEVERQARAIGNYRHFLTEAVARPKGVVPDGVCLLNGTATLDDDQAPTHAEAALAAAKQKRRERSQRYWARFCRMRERAETAEDWGRAMREALEPLRPWCDQFLSGVARDLARHEIMREVERLLKPVFAALTHPAPPAVTGPTDKLLARELACSLDEIVTTLAALPTMQTRRFLHLGIRADDILAKARAAGLLDTVETNKLGRAPVTGQPQPSLPTSPELRARDLIDALSKSVGFPEGHILVKGDSFDEWHANPQAVSIIAAAISAAEANARADGRMARTEDADNIRHDAVLIKAELGRVQSAHGAYVLLRDPSGMMALLSSIMRQADALKARPATEGE
ncbi:hypothetical protein J2847_005798 [Azospirillum agricola]|uniref:hypothetical protein n=1 Tax=Azospirillum agricola TaxID=1720247 RepID=UPI001AE48B6A|nr:hypothetical protein [Azospirillum agricola]MBP2232469.1 hypothetical protein [Azospirillum agricola]